MIMGIYCHAKGIAVGKLDGLALSAKDYAVDSSNLYLVWSYLDKVHLANRVQIAAPDLHSPTACLIYGAAIGVLSTYQIRPTIVPNVDYMAAIKLGPKGKKEQALTQVYKLWQMSLQSQAEALALAVSVAQSKNKKH